jgi:hypothetical protein
VLDPLDSFGQWGSFFGGKPRDYVVHHNLEEEEDANLLNLSFK